jgi:hypothetical protein
MGYYIRVLGTTDRNIHIDDLINGLTQKGLTAKFETAQDENPGDWTVVGVANSEGVDLIQIERNPVADGELGQEELEEFRQEIKGCKPASAAKWLDKYFDKVKVIYAFQLLDASMEEKNFSILDSIKTTIWKFTCGILQADNEGFSNEAGYHILWQFADDVTGEWNMSVRNLFGNWTNFRMNLGDQKQRETFWNGKVPNNATRLQ